MTDRNRPTRKTPRQTTSRPQEAHAERREPAKQCVWCGSRNTEHVLRGLANVQESKNQYLRCHDCDRLTYEIVAETGREVRLGRYRSGGEYRDPINRTRYVIYRMLKIGFDEYLLYLRPVLPE